MFLEDIDRKVKVFLENGRRKEVQVEIRVQGWRRMVWLQEVKSKPHEN